MRKREWNSAAINKCAAVEVGGERGGDRALRLKVRGSSTRLLRRIALMDNSILDNIEETPGDSAVDKLPWVHILRE